eukprot:9183292-Heterocapsa_arctica.AAC.1
MDMCGSIQVDLPGEVDHLVVAVPLPLLDLDLGDHRQSGYREQAPFPEGRSSGAAHPRAVDVGVEELGPVVLPCIALDVPV